MKRQDVIDISLFVFGTLFIVFPPTWVLQWEAFSEQNEVIVNFLVISLVIGFVLLGYLFKRRKNSE